MIDRSQTLLQPGDSRWEALANQKRQLLSHADATVSERLVRGQRLSAQAAALRRGVRRDRAAGS